MHCACTVLLFAAAVSSEPEPDLHRQMAPPRFVAPITNCDVSESAPARFEAVVEGQPKPQVTWFREGHQIVPSNDFQVSVAFLSGLLQQWSSERASKLPVVCQVLIKKCQF